MDEKRGSAKWEKARGRESVENRRLLDAVARSHAKEALAALRAGASPDARYPLHGEALRGWTVSMLCAEQFKNSGRAPEMSELDELVLTTCDPFAVDPHGLTPLMHAAGERNIEAVSILAPRSDLDAVSGDMGKDFDGAWPALFFALNANQSFLTKSGKRELALKMKSLIDILGTQKILSGLKSREGLDASWVAQRFGNAPEIVGCLAQARGRWKALAEKKEIEASAERPLDKIVGKARSI